MKILKLGDLHFGVKQDDAWVQNLQSKLIDLAIEYSKANGIKHWIQAGDWFDVRKAITHKCMEFNREQCQKISDAGIHIDVIVGNHDATFKNTITPNACTELLTQWSNITVYDKPTTVEYDGVFVDLIPWMCDENTTEIMEHIKTSSAEYCVGHWELNGFYFYKGMKSHGLEPDFLKKYKEVWSGHFHTISKAANVTYLGTPYTITAGDENDERGFWVFDTSELKSTFVPNPDMWHRRIYYPFEGKIDAKEYTNLSVRVIVEQVDKDLPKFESDMEQVVHELRVVSKVDSSSDMDTDSDTVEVKSITDLMEEYIDGIAECTPEDKTAIKQFSKQLWVECTS
ncbi:gp47 recombination endonuclease subunit [Acinetobacter phage Ac42]|uniref:gp47 recombination endonuclease subunit n=1 Tax=Acinetobacter phage Ac42 TaxID=762660 RepID=UPI0001EBCD03|nr:gp47 recombination endonuclease subunit [Acinetobacter phage Ac42]ADI96343.1 gp47 recombination endonuclease subunit [Acinetobacter phage Ac42]